MVVLTPLLFDQDLRFSEREEEFAVQQVVLQLAVEERTGLVVVSETKESPCSSDFLDVPTPCRRASPPRHRHRDSGFPLDNQSTSREPGPLRRLCPGSTAARGPAEAANRDNAADRPP